jgi:4-amino-4-deoxy-L-arabinose transferase-like glycosyltransferase
MSSASTRAAPRAWLPSFAIGVPALAVTAVTLLAGGLRLYSLARVPANPFYDAAVRSMGLSWHNFFFAAFEPSGRIAVDKPPVDLWLQVASVKLFGFNSIALKLPEALAGTLSVPLLYDLVRRVFGRGAGLASALALAVLPVTVLTSRSDTMDTVMMLLIVAAAWLVVHAAQTGRARYLLLAAAVMGLDFNVKLFEALLPLPALVLLYLLASRDPIPRRVAYLLASGLVFVAVSLSWVLAVTATPAKDRPFPLGSSNGTVWNAIFVFDGTHRLGMNKHSGTAKGTNSVARNQLGAKSSSSSPTRLVARAGPSLGLRVGSELVPAVIFGGLAVALSLGGAQRSRERRAIAIALAVWLALGCLTFSAVGRLQLRYLEALTPAIAAALGIGLAVIVESVGRRPGARAALAAGVALTAVYGFYLAAGTPRLRVVVAGVALLALLALLGPVVRRRRWAEAAALPAVAGVLALATALAVPASASVAVVRHHATDASTGLRLPPRTVRLLDRFLVSHQGGARYEVATLNAYQAAPLIVRAGRPVLILFNVNRHRLLTRHALRAEARTGQVHYVLLGSECGRSQPGRGQTRRRARPLVHKCVSTARWVRSHGRPVRVYGRYFGLYRIARR